MEQPLIVQRLKPCDWVAFKQIRLAALCDASGAFEAVYSHESQRTDEEWMDMLSCPGIAIFGATSPSGDLVGIAHTKALDGIDTAVRREYCAASLDRSRGALYLYNDGFSTRTLSLDELYAQLPDDTRVSASEFRMTTRPTANFKVRNTQSSFYSIDILTSDNCVVFGGAYVRPSYRRQGIANRLWKARLDHAILLGKTYVSTSARQSSVASLRLISKLGFRAEGFVTDSGTMIHVQPLRYGWTGHGGKSEVAYDNYFIGDLQTVSGNARNLFPREPDLCPNHSSSLQLQY